jgi:hypothetical protein
MTLLDQEITMTSGRSASAPRPRATRRENLLTVVFAGWLIAGLFVDGWAHNNDKPESFFTPWHGIFYSGFGATAAWMGWIVQKRRLEGATGPAAVPVGYGLGLLGVAVFALGGLFDMVWHEVFGIEVDLEALLSPSHLILFSGGLLVVTSPLRAAWADPESMVPSFRQFLPALLSVTLATATVAFFFMVFAPTLSGAMSPGPYRFIAHSFGANSDTASWITEEVQLEGYAAILFTTIILMAPALLIMHRWVLPFGTLTFLFGVVSTLVASIESFGQGFTFASAALAGLAGDLLYQRLQPAPDRPWRLRAFASVVPPVMWLAYFAILATSPGVGWSVELWGGVCVMSAMVGFGLALMTVPPPVPPLVTLDARQP